MKFRSYGGRLLGDSEGSLAVVVAISLVVLLGVAALAIDVGQLASVKSDLQNTTDSAAMAAARALIVDNGATTGFVQRDHDNAVTQANAIIQRADESQGLTWDTQGDDISIIFANYADHSSTWTAIPDQTTSGVNTSNANAVQVTVKRASNKNYGAVTNFFASVFGMGTTEVAATAKAYMGFATSVYAGTVQVPLALPSTGTYNPLASKSNPGWWDKIFGPEEAVAATQKTIVFRDSGGFYDPQAYVTGTPTNVDNNVSSTMSFSPTDPRQIYLFTVGQNDAVPGTIQDILYKIYNPTYSSSNPVKVAKLALGQTIYPRSEFCWGKSYIGPIFQKLRAAYYYKTTGSATTQPPGTLGNRTPWRVTLAVYGATPNPLIHSKVREGFRYLTRLLRPWPTDAFACATVTPVIYVNGFVNADITDVTYDSNSDDCNYSFPITLTAYPPVTGSTTYQNKKDCLTRYSKSTWNANAVYIKNVTDVSTIIPYNPTTNRSMGGEGGGLSAKEMNSAAATNVGAFANIPKLLR
jgi:Flp pilus assembly protein TadG